MRLRWIVPILLLALAVPVAAQPAVNWSDRVVPVNDVVVVYPNGTLTIGPGSVVTGPGRIEVWGTLDIAGDPARPAEVSVPILLLGNGSSVIDHARLWGVHGAAIAVRSGSVSIHDTVFDANDLGLDVGGNGSATLSDSALRDHALAAVRVAGSARLEVSRATFERNTRALEAASATSLLVQDSIFVGNATQLDVDWDGGGLNATFLRNDFSAPHPTGGPLVVLREANESGAGPAVAFAGNRIHGASVGVLVVGPGPAFQSENDTIDGNVVGISLRLGAAHLIRTTLGNSRNLEGAASSDVSLDNVTYLADATTTVLQPGAAPFPWGPVGGGVALVAILGLLVAQPLASRRARPPTQGRPAVVLPLESPAAPATMPEAPPGLPPLGPQELKILRDLASNPGSAQSAIAARLGVTRQALHYHVKKLEAKGLLVKTAKGRETLCELSPGVRERLPPS